MLKLYFHFGAHLLVFSKQSPINSLICRGIGVIVVAGPCLALFAILPLFSLRGLLRFVILYLLLPVFGAFSVANPRDGMASTEAVRATLRAV